MAELSTSFGTFEIAEYVPEATESDVQPLIDALKSADGDDWGKNVAYINFPTEADANKYKAKIRRAARPSRTSYAKITKTPDDTFVLAVRLIKPYPSPKKKDAVDKMDKK